MRYFRLIRPTTTECTVNKPLTNVGSHTGAYGPVEWGLTLTIGLIWGSAFLWIAMGVDHLSPGVVAFGRVALGAGALSLFPAARRRVAREDWTRIAAIAVIGNAAPALLFAIAETELDSAVAGMITGGTPILSLVVASVLLRSLPPRTQAIGIGLGFLGIILMALPSLRGSEAAPLGVGLVVIATLGYAISGNLLVPMQQRYGGPAITLWALVFSSVILAPFGLFTIRDSEFTASSVIAVVILGVIGTGVSRSLAATLAGRAGAPRMSTTTYMIPVVAIILGVTIRNETVTPVAIIGVGLVLISAVIASRAVRSRSPGSAKH
jgi:drug/metabolite transporter (DMT)-like permease